MGIQIESGTGNGRQAGVSESNQLKTHSVIVSEEHSANMDKGLAFAWRFADDPDANDDCIFYIKNEDEKNLVLEEITISVSGACEVYFQIGNAGVVSTGTDVTGVNLHSGSGNTPSVTAKNDGDLESGSTLTSGNECERYIFRAASDSAEYNFPSDIVLTKNGAFTIWCSAAGVVVTATLYGYFQNPVHV